MYDWQSLFSLKSQNRAINFGGFGKGFQDFGVADIRHMTAATAAVTLARSSVHMYWKGFTLAMCLVLELECTK